MQQSTLVPVDCHIITVNCHVNTVTVNVGQRANLIDFANQRTTLNASGKIGYRSFQVDLTFRLESGRVQVRFRSGSFQVGFISGRVRSRSGYFRSGPKQIIGRLIRARVDFKSGSFQVGFISGRFHFRSGPFQFIKLYTSLFTCQVNNRSGSKQVGFKNRSGSKQVGFGCYSNRSDSVPGQHQSVTDRVRVIAASGQTKF
ncbi:hypothetical protein GQ457_15G014460 [Hibiscus cannabinus]